MASEPQDKRSSPRKKIHVAAKLHTGDAQVPAEALNLSTSGIFLECPTRVIEGSPVDIVMILPDEITGAGSKWVCCQATVRRVEDHNSGRYGVAATVEKIQAMPEITWPEKDRRVTERRTGNDRRKNSRGIAPDRRGSERRSKTS